VDLYGGHEELSLPNFLAESYMLNVTNGYWRSHLDLAARPEPAYRLHQRNAY